MKEPTIIIGKDGVEYVIDAGKIVEKCLHKTTTDKSTASLRLRRGQKAGEVPRPENATCKPDVDLRNEIKKGHSANSGEFRERKGDSTPITHLKAVREEACHQGAHEMDLKVTENFNRALKDESSELVKILKELARFEALQEVIDSIKYKLEKCTGKTKYHEGWKDGLQAGIDYCKQKLKEK